jgi:hypothetical protein
MLIWTTPELKELIGNDFPLKLCDREDIKGDFLRNASLNDGAVIPAEEDYLEFIARVKANGIEGPIIFISSGDFEVSEELYSYNAIYFDKEKVDPLWLRRLLRFIFKIALSRGIPDIHVKPPEFSTEKPSADRPVVNSTRISEVINYIIEKDISIIISFEIPEKDRAVTVRGVCRLKKDEKGLKLYHFRPALIIKGMKKDASIKTVLPYKDTAYETTIIIKEVGDREVVVSIPDFLLVERRRHVRVVPSPHKPVRLYILIPGEETISPEVVDISQRGIGFITPRELRVNDVYAFTIVLPEPEEIILSYGIIKYKGTVSAGYRYGVELKIHPKDEEIIAQYITKREVEIIELLRNL